MDISSTVSRGRFVHQCQLIYQARFPEASFVNALLPNIVHAAEERKLEEKLDSLLTVHKRYFGHLLCTEY